MKYQKFLIGMGAIGASLPLFATIISCGSSKEASFNLEDKNLDVGMEVNYAPYNFLVTDQQWNGLSATQKSTFSDYVLPIEGGRAGGFDVYVSKQIADLFDVNLVIHKMDWDALIPSMTNKGQLDAIIAGMSKTPEREELIAFSNSYFDANLGTLYDADQNAPTAVGDLVGSIYAQQGTTHFDLAKIIARANGGEAIPVADAATLYAEVLKGHWGITENAVGELAASQTDGLEFILGGAGTNHLDLGDEISSSNIGLPKTIEADDLSKINGWLATFESSQESVLTRAIELYSAIG